MLSVILLGPHEDRGTMRPFPRITFSRAKLARLRVVAIVTLALGGCAPSKPLILAPTTSGARHGPAYATVAAVRPIRAFAGLGIDPQAAILTAMSGSPSSPAPSASSSEIVVRTDGGETLSVVQPDSADLAPGERVIIVPGGLTRLTPASPQS
jgi:outer membrane lipoprotein SlyB